MRKIFTVAIGLVITMIAVILGYGFYLNYSNEKNIALSIAHQKRVYTAVRCRTEEIFNRWVRWPVKLYSAKRADVVSRNAGILSRIYVEPGQKVKEGQLLALVTSEEIDSKLTELTAEIARVKTMRDKYKVSYERYNRLKDMGAVSLEQYDMAKAEYFGAAEEVKAMTAQREQYELMRERLSLKAPFDGEVKFVYKKETSYLTQGTPVMMVGDFSTMYFYDDNTTDEDILQLSPIEQEFKLLVEEKELQKVYKDKYSPGNSNYANMGKDDYYAVKGYRPYKVKIVKIEPGLDQKADTRTVTYAVDNSSGDLEPKIYQNVIFCGTEVKKAVVVPFSAVGDNLTAVMVLNKDGVIEKRQVKVGPTYEGDDVNVGTKAAVLDGLQENELVLCDFDAFLAGKKNVEFTVREW